MIFRKFMIPCLVLLLAFTGFGCDRSEKTTNTDAEQLIRYNLGAEPETLDPAKMTGMPEGTIANALFEGMVRYDAQSNIQPGMAENWEISNNGLVYTFKLREAYWSNGDPVTAGDFKFAWLRALDPALATDYAYQLYYIKGAEAYNSGQGKTEDVAIKVLDSRTLEVTLNAPTHQFLGLTAFQSLVPLNEKVVAANPEWHKSPDSLVCNGPFKLDSWERKQKLTLVKNTSYWDADSVKLKKLEIYSIENHSTALTMYKTGKLDFLEQPPSQEIPNLKATSEYKIFPDSSVYFYRLNNTLKPLDDPKVRKALAMAIERQPIVDNILQAGQRPALAFVPYGFTDSGQTKDFRDVGGNTLFKEDIAEARNLLAEAGYPEGKDFPKVSVQFNSNDTHQKIAQAIQQMWKKNLGIDVQLASKDWHVFLKNQQELDYDISRSGWNPDYLDPMTFMDMFVTNGGNNNTGWSNSKYDDLIRQANSTGDNTLRIRAMHEAETILMNEMPIIPIYFYVNDDLIKDNIKNLIVPSFGLYAEFKWAYVE